MHRVRTFFSNRYFAVNASAKLHCDEYFVTCLWVSSWIWQSWRFLLFQPVVLLLESSDCGA